MNRKYDLTEPPGSPVPSPSALPGASDKQLNFLTSLLQERDLPTEAHDAISKRVAAQVLLNEAEGDCVSPGDRLGLTKRRASEFISRLLEQPKRPVELPRPSVVRDIVGEHHPEVPGPDVLPKGHYAVENEDGELRFYHLWRGDRNPNYIKLYVEHGPDDSEVAFKAAKTILGKIVAAGPEACARRYGREIGSCSQCGRRLTNRVSRLLDIGPVCGGRFRDDFDDEVAAARDAIRAAGLDPKGDVEDTDDLDRIRELAGL